MNPRMPYYPAPTTSSDYHHNGYAPTHRWNDMRQDASMNNTQNWDRNNRNAWKRNNNRNWQPKFNREQQAPYTVPKKVFNSRAPRNRYDNGPTGYYDTNGHSQNWPQQHNKTKPLKSPEDKDSEQAIPGIIASKKKRKPMSKSYPSSKWDEKDAEKALQAERDFIKNLKKQSLIIRFPDPELSKEIVQEFHPLIESVHFPHASTPRYCFAHLQETADIEKVVTTLKKIPFGQGFLGVDIKKAREENCEIHPKDIDPYTLYVGNLPMNVTKQGVTQQYPGCTRIDIGHPQQLKNTRYAFIRFANVDDAIKAYKNTRNTQFESRSLIVRFRRINGNVGVPGESKQTNLTKTNAETPPISTPPPTLPPKTVDCLPVTSTPNTSIILPVNSTITSQVLDLNLVKEEPTSDVEDNFDVKPDAVKTNGFEPVVKMEIKNEPMDAKYDTEAFMTNEDDIEHAEQEDYINDTFQYIEDPVQEDYESEDDYDDEEDGESDLDLNDTFLPYDDDGDMFNEYK